MSQSLMGQFFGENFPLKYEGVQRLLVQNMHSTNKYNTVNIFVVSLSMSHFICSLVCLSLLFTLNGVVKCRCQSQMINLANLFL